MGATADVLDSRVGIAGVVKFISRKIFPEHWSFLLGEIALWSFVVLILTGIFMTMFFEPSMTHTTYPEDALPVSHQGMEMSAAYASTVYMSFEVKGGLLMRQMHHWAALLFMAAIVTHAFRIFFTGAFRKPREINYLVGFTLMILGLAAGFSGYSLPDDVLSGNGLRIADGVAKSIPIIGSYASYGLFGGEFPGTDIIPRLFTVHILLVPAAIVALVTVHLILMVVHKHTQYPGVGRSNKVVVGYPAFPVYAVKMAGFFFIVFGFLAMMGAFMAINNVWNYGPYDPSPVSAGAQPDWYMLFLEGSLRLMPGWEIVIGGYTLSLNILIPGVVIPGLLFTFLALYPFIEAAATNDRREHHILDRPRNVPVRTGLGVGYLTAFGILVLAGSNDLIATHFDLSINDITWAFRILFFVAPVVAFIVTKRICLGLQRRDRELALHGHETGRVVQLANGAFMEVHKPLTDEERWILVAHEPHRPIEIEPATDRNGVDRPGYRIDAVRQKLSQFFYEDRVEPVTPAELAAAGHHPQIEETGHHAEGIHGGAVALDHFPTTTHGSGDEESARGGSVATLARSERR
ncbi:cytochrome bc1 complex cytochrome b subunit [Georgenia subflava]|uniref:Cytochrome bc1 complex cytochrome b subunit n=1 Tax=Georgenia subflava TaxID=1622177 RepID=A0A6N7EKJ0_9MICO|nr:cytochrome bc complex cytochrome b subunit [Georgenia subflava]MPV38580.1 ubiquinol-cytochrome c reductase cytochrome b subunit [Georgenia subflava]